MEKPKSLEGIISYLTKEHAGNVQEKGIVTITAKSVDDDDADDGAEDYALRNVADLKSDSCFCSKNEPYQWICWDFHKMRICPTHYTMTSVMMKSWVVEGSLDGANWTGIHEQTDSPDFRGQAVVSFAVSSPSEWRFIRLTQTAKREDGYDRLAVIAVEFFGTLYE
jgi:hypothetical protein